MKLFISWSGEFSGKVAKRLSIWIPTIIQTVDVFYSPDDIAKGENWGNRLTEELEQSNFGIVCLTPENVAAPWIHFEAGALSKAANSRVSAIMLGVTPSDVKGPLARLQNTTFDRDDFYRLFQSINNSSDTPLRPEVFNNAFDNSWQRLMDDVDPIIKAYVSRIPTQKAENDKREEHSRDSDALQEILRLVRKLDGRRNVPTSNFTPTSIFEPNELLGISRSRDILLELPKEYADNAIRLICMYLPEVPSKNMRIIKSMLRTHGACHLSIPEDQLEAFESALYEITPKATITV